MKVLPLDREGQGTRLQEGDLAPPDVITGDTVARQRRLLTGFPQISIRVIWTDLQRT